ncbi:hypothetical protein [Oceaniradius stylonematis]|uniref:hypothetical protein n=1 Tax=Oceaniradius stylonematis TaxID=2184161 RepID=UPI00273F1BBC|nr:hypothetical protein [Oceaniradius stylonematis]
MKDDANDMECAFQIPREGRYADPTLTDLEIAATEWLDGFYQLEHLLAAREWAITLDPNASTELRFAALVHDAERFFPGGPSGTPQDGFDNPDYLFAHSIRSADIVDEWLDTRQTPPSPTFRKRVRALILRHEIGGNPEEDMMQAADSLAFLSTFDWLVLDWVANGFYTVEGVLEKLDWMFTRIRVSSAVPRALPLYVGIVTAVKQAGTAPFDTHERRQLAGHRPYLLGKRL